MRDPELDPLGTHWRRYLDTGDEEAMEALVAATRPRLRAAARRIVADTEADDAVQSAFLSLVRQGRAARGVPVLPWLLTATIRLAYRQSAKRRREVDVARRLAVPGTASRAVRADLRADEAEIVRRAVFELPDTYRDAVVLHYLGGLSTAETARSLGIAEGAVRVRLHRARGILRARRPLRALLGLVLFPAGMLDRLRTWRRAGYRGAVGLGSLPGAGVVGTAVVLAVAWTGASLARAPDAAAAPVSPLAHAVPDALPDGAAPGVDHRASAEVETGASVAREVEETFFLSGGRATRCEVERRGDAVVRHGRFTSWRTDGTLESSGKYVDGLRQGRWTYVHPNGARQEQGTFRDDEMDGLWVGWGPDGQKTSETRYLRGVLHGVSTTWHSTRRWRAGLDDVPVQPGDPPIATDAPPVATVEIRVGGVRDGLWEFRDVNGWLRETRTYRDGAQDGPTTYFHRGRPSRVVPYVDDLRHGEEVHYDGAGHVVGTLTLVDGRQHGVATSFYPDGRTRCVQHFADGAPHGSCTHFHPNGRRAQQSTFHEGRVVGTTERWNADGRLVFRGQHDARGPRGSWTTWDDAGNRIALVRYDGGLVIEEKRWDAAGRLLMEGGFDSGRLRSGTWGFRTPDGEWVELTYAKGRPRTGTLVVHDAPGGGTHATDYAERRKHGQERRWSAAGELVLRGTWTAGRRSGIWETLAAGEVVDRTDYDDATASE